MLGEQCACVKNVPSHAGARCLRITNLQSDNHVLVVVGGCVEPAVDRGEEGLLRDVTNGDAEQERKFGRLSS